MIVLEFRFPAGRYHATPWGHHVNEGLVEWPPSPWRILRALCATWHAKANEEIPEVVFSGLIDSLSAELPSYELPPAALSHTRHYMPLFEGKTTKIFDAFAHIGIGQALRVVWPDTELSDEARSSLGLLVSRLGYLGRAESWIAGRLGDGGSLGRGLLVGPMESAVDPTTHEIVRLLAPLPANAMAQWRATAVDEQLTRALAQERSKEAAKGKDPDKVKLSPKKKHAIDASLPATVIDALQADTGSLRKAGWSRPPATRWIEYARPRSAFASASRARRSRSTAPVLEVARFAVASNVPNRLTETMTMAYRVRGVLLRASRNAPVFSGRDEHDRRLQGHQHAFILPEANGRDGRITHVTVYSPGIGFDGIARWALEQLTAVGRDRHPLQLILLGMGKAMDFAGDNVVAGQCPLFSASTVWESRTPFIPTRHPKATRTGQPKLDNFGFQIGSAAHDLIRLLTEAGYPRPQKIEPIHHVILGGKPTRWLAFRTTRPTGGGLRATNAGTGFRITFAEPVTGPIALGYGAHFGLGTFIPEAAADQFR